MSVANIISQRSTCRRGNVGCVIVNQDKRIVATGYNGTPAGEPHEPHKHTRVDCKAIHAEINALTYLSTEEVINGGLTIYLTRSPCYDCFAALNKLDIKTVYYSVAHSTVLNIERLATKAGVELIYWPNILYEKVI